MHTHTLNIDLGQITQGKNSYTCTTCSAPVVLVWNGYQDNGVFVPCSWGVRHEDASDPTLANMAITYL